tara:strand:+ start:1974 stop:2669 length:696 start_codon:yes stop_codon:yes gene_type:complete
LAVFSLGYDFFMSDESSPSERILFDRALAKFDAVVRQVPTNAWANQSPCEEWTAANIVGHVAATTQLPVLLAQRIPLGVPEGPEASEVPTRGNDDLFISKTMLSLIRGLPEEAIADPLVVWNRCYAEMNEVLSGDVWGQPPLGTQRGTMTLEEWLEPAFYDSTVHTWDLSQAAGVPHNLDDELCNAALTTLKSIEVSGNMRSSNVFAGALDPQSDEPLTQLIAYTGRTPIR